MAITVTSSKVVLLELEKVTLYPTNLIKNFKGLDKEEVRTSNRYYAEYRLEYLVENLAWSKYCILNTCKKPLRNKILEEMVDYDPLETCGTLVLQLMLDIIMEIDDNVLRALTQIFQNLCRKDLPSKNIYTAVSYLKGAILLLQNCSGLPTDTIWLLNNMM